jgi:hypothetical protein
MMGMFTRRPRTIILTHQDDLTQMLGRHPDFMHESGTGKVLIRESALDEERHRRLQKKMLAEKKSECFVEITGVTKPTDAVGASRREKNRVTMIMRQGMFGYFDPEQTIPKGEVLASVLLVQGARHARLEDMSHFEPAVWNRDHRFSIDGQEFIRKKGERVGAMGMNWRETRRKYPDLFYASRKGSEEEWKQGPVRLWFQAKATEDTIIACWLSDMIVEETRHIFMEGIIN